MRSVTACRFLSVLVVAMLATMPIIAVSSSSAEPAETITETEYSGLTPWDNVNQVLSIPFLTLGAMYTTIGNWIRGDIGEQEIGDPDSVGEYAQMVKSKSIIKMINVVSSLSTKLVANDKETWSLTESYINRLAEISASTLWNSDASTDLQDPNAILVYAGIYDLIAKGNGNTQSALDWGMYHSMDELIALYQNDQQLYRDITASFIWSGHFNDFRSNQHMTLDFETISKVTSSSNSIVYLDLDYMSNLDIETGLSTSAGKIYCSGIGAIRSLESNGWTNINGSLSLSVLKNQGLSSGWYQLREGYTYAGPFYPSMNGNSAPCSGGAVLVNGSDVGFLTIQDGNLYLSYNGGNDTNVSYLTVAYRFSDNTVYTGGGSSNSYYSCIYENDVMLKDLISAYSVYYAELYERISSASSAAHLMWRISGDARSSNIFLSPSSVIPQIRELGYDEDMAYVLYRAALDESAQWYENYGKVLNDGEVTLSEESLKLTFSGKVFDKSGNVTSVSDTSFIPVVYLKDYVLTEGRNEFDDNAGILIGVQTGSIYYMTFGSYFTVNDNGIVYDGRTVGSVTLHVKGVEEIGIHDLNKPTDPTVPSVKSGDVLCAIIMVEFGAIIALVSLLFRAPIGIAIGAVLAILGIVFSGTIADILLGLLG
ncbi:MAG: hypothetical protein IJT54_08445 [Candidatus Methanomethylophilaceae archaeon]|nr:hypothetical protein [Candidatus Methanomethylophilaceae archaeon]